MSQKQTPKFTLKVLSVSSGYKLASCRSFDSSGKEVRQIAIHKYIHTYIHTALDFKTSKLNFKVVRGNGIFQKSYLIRNKKAMTYASL